MPLVLHGFAESWEDVESAHQIVTVRDILEWRTPVGRQQISRLEQIRRSCKEILEMRRDSAWRLARKWRRRVGGATCLLECAPFDGLTDNPYIS